jgi:hypothetical protein
MKYILTLLGGIVVGGLLVYFLFAGAPGARGLPPGERVAAPDPGGPPPTTAQVTLTEPFFNALVGTIFRDLGAPTFPLQLAAVGRTESVAPPSFRSEDVAFHESLARRGQRNNGGAQFINAQAGCANEIRLMEEGAGVRTSVRFVDGKVMVPIAFSGTYSFGQCWNFRGWAQARFDLYFNRERQTLYGRINVEGVNLEGVNPLVSGFVTPLVQNVINQRVGDIEIMRSQQLALAVPVAMTGGNLRAQVTDVRAEITDTIRLFITYNFNGERGNSQNTAPPRS